MHFHYDWLSHEEMLPKSMIRWQTFQLAMVGRLNTPTVRPTYKFGWLQGSRKVLKQKKFWSRGLDLNI
jgi:hypothetical protein